MSSQIETVKQNLPATQMTVDPYEKLANEESNGAILKFAKGEWMAGDEVMNDTRMTAEFDKLAIGWRKWRDSKIVDADIGYVADGFKPKIRAELDDLDGNVWPLNARGERSDPWQYGFYLRFVDEEGATFTWSATSRGARGAVASLARCYASRRKRGLNGLPIVTLSSDFYRHKEFGKVDIPVLACTGWTDDAEDQVKAECTAAPFNDDLPELRG